MIGISEEVDSFLDQKCTYEKWTKNLGRAPPPHLDKIQKNSYFFRETFPNTKLISQAMQSMLNQFEKMFGINFWRNTILEVTLCVC